MSYRYLSTLLTCKKSSRYIFLVIASICILTFISQDSTDKISSFIFPKISKNFIVNRVNHSSSSYNTIKVTSTKQHQQVNKIVSINILNDIIEQRLRTHAAFFNEPSSACNETEIYSLERKTHFQKIVQALNQFRQEPIPLYSDDYFHGRGIVLTVGGSQMHHTKVNLKMIERTKTRIPVQIWYSSLELTDSFVNDYLRHVPKLNLSVCSFTRSECRNRNRTWQLNSSYVFLPAPKTHDADKYFPYKPAAIISSTFTEVLFLDSDSYLVRDPEYLFQSDPMYLRFGALFFPDALVSSQDLAIWQLLNITCRPDEAEFDSGALLVNKKRVWNALYLTKFMNDRFDLFYKWFSAGDKDTFRFAFRLLRVEYYMVDILCSTGQYNGTHFCGLSMCKTDSLGQHIFINHISLIKYVKAGYSSDTLGYTRIGLGDPYNHTFYMQFCQSGVTELCLLIGTIDNETSNQHICYDKQIAQDEIDHRIYGLNESLMSESFRDHRMLMSKTNNLMPGFLSSLFRYRKQVFGDRWIISYEHVV